MWSFYHKGKCKDTKSKLKHLVLHIKPEVTIHIESSATTERKRYNKYMLAERYWKIFKWLC